MAEKKKCNGVITSQTMLSDGIFSMWIRLPKELGMVENAVAGQFVSLYCREGSRLLPRPISICELNREDGLLRVVYRVVGKGTEEFSRLPEGESIAVAGPFGNGFPKSEGRHILIGGGIGIPPMLELARELSGETIAVLGYRDSNLFLKEELEQYATVYVSTEDGSVGTKGNVVDALTENRLTDGTVYACGPMPMLRGVKAYAQENGMEAWLSLEERMACGIGACLACVCKSAKTDAHSNVKNKRVCKDGPVFRADEVELD